MTDIVDDDFEYEELYFVKIPETRGYDPGELLSLNLVCSEHDLNPDNSGDFTEVYRLKYLKEEFITGDDYALIIAYKIALQNRIYPPLWVLEGLNAKFKKWDDSNLNGGYRPIDDFFDTGGKIAFRDRCFSFIYDQMRNRYWILKRFWGLNDDDCFEVLALSIEWDYENIPEIDKIKHIKPVFTARTIRDIHKTHKWKVQYDRQTAYIQKYPDKHSDFMTNEEVENFLNLFPDSAKYTIKSEAHRNPTLTRRNKSINKP